MSQKEGSWYRKKPLEDETGWKKGLWQNFCANFF
jgi:hypothetical protein